MKFFLSFFLFLFFSSFVFSFDSFQFQECNECLSLTESFHNNYSPIDIVDKICFLYKNDTRYDCQNELYKIINNLQQQTDDIDEINFTPRNWCNLARLCSVSCCESENPEQVHISVTGSPNEMVVIWIQSKLAADAFVKYYETSKGSKSEITINNVPSKTYYAGGWRGHIYTQVLSNLSPSTTYNYTVGTVYGQLGYYYSFTTPPVSNALSNVTFIAYGDMGDDDDAQNVMDLLFNRVPSDNVDLLIHIGDISYAGGDMNVWDEWERNIAPIAANYPYMAVEGNHESTYLFTAYNHRFRNPSQESRSNTTKYFSFDYGNIHFLAFTFEDLLDLDNNPIMGKQREWIEQDLAQANQRRNITPWIVAFAHRPLYCTYQDRARCITEASRYRFQLEDVFNNYNVDLILNGHNHNYERTYPVYKRKPTAKNYTNPEAPVYIVQGSAGRGKDTGFRQPGPSWSVRDTRIADYGISEISTYGDKTLTFSWIQASSNSVYDSFTIQKN